MSKDPGRIHYRISFWDAEGHKIPGPVMQAPEEAVEVAGAELWLVPEEDGPFYEKEEYDEKISTGTDEAGPAAPTEALGDAPTEPGPEGGSN